ncbi:MAG: SH3 domain-containing protein [Clostridiales bacterium]|nr:SH3 domain-containing protein [Clostridiales bacterium]
MQSFFYGLARQSLTAGWMILALLVLRPLLKKAPRAVSCLLWGLAAVRLVFPFSLESRVSLVPQQIAAPVRVTPIDPTYFAGPTIQTGAPAAAQVVSRGISWREVVPWVWLIGVAVMGIYALVSYLRLAGRVRASVRIKDRLYICDNVSSPFILGLFRPKIYLPSDLVQPATDYVLAHERAHLRRGDHLWKPLGYALLTVYWFNPLCWLAYILFCRDMEQACDEAVIKNMTQKDKKAYSAALLQCSMPRSAIAACPVAFGEVSVKQRIRGVLNYRRPTLWVVAASAVLCMVLAACFLTDPVEANQAEAEATESAELQKYPLYSSPSEGSRTVYQLLPGEDYTIIRTEPIGDRLWAYVVCQDGKTFGWMILGTEEAAFAKTSEAAIETPKPDGDYITYPREVIVYSAPDHDSWELARYPAGMPVSLDGLEVVEGGIWGYVKYLDGETLGWISLDEIMDAFINRQSSFSLRTAIYSSPSRQARQIGQGEIGDVYLLQSMEPFGENIWGYIEYQKENTTIMGWILLNEGKAPLSDLYEVPVYSSPSEDGRILCELAFGEDFTILERETIENTIWAYVECQEGMTRGWVRLVQGSESEIFLSGTVNVEALNVRSGPGAMNSAVGVLEGGTKVIILEVVSDENRQWGRIGSNAWVNMAYIDCGGEASVDAALSDPIEATQYAEPDDSAEESYTFSRETNVYSSPSEQARVVAQATAGEVGTITRREFIADGSWGYVQLQGGKAMGWVHFVEEDEALNYFRGYVEAYNQPGPDEAEQYLYFTSEYAREFFRDNYAPITGWYPSGIFRVNENLWGIQYADSNSDRMVYSFVGRIDDRLYVFQNVHQVPEELSENLDVAAYEEENAMYLSDEYMECYSVIKQLLPFADPTYVTVEDKGTKDYSDAAPCPIEDVICGTDTWRVVPEPKSYGSPSCIITLTARDGSVATICDSSPVILVTDADGTQQWFQGWASGEELVGMLYSWAKSIEWTPGE